MGIDINGVMIVGCPGEDLIYRAGGATNLYKLIEELSFDYAAPYFDADLEECIIGYMVEEVVPEDKLEEWVSEVKEKMEGFYDETGECAKLYGMQNVW